MSTAPHVPHDGRISRGEVFNRYTAVVLPMVMAAVDQTLLATASPHIAAALGGVRDTSWIAVAYLLASATAVPFFGRLGDAHGRRNVLLVCLGLFTLGSLAAGASITLPQLIAARVVQGLGGGGLMIMSQALIGELVPPRQRVRFQVWFGLLYTAASITGPVLGGVVVAHASWRWLFLANAPLALFAAWRLLRLPAGDKHPSGHAADITGNVLFALSAVTLLYWLTSGGHRFPWLGTESLAWAGVGTLALVFLVRHELRHVAPFLPVELLRERTIGRLAMLVSLFAACMFSLVFLLPLYLQFGRGISVQASGYLLLPVVGGMVVGAMVSGQILRRTGRPHWIPVTGMSVASVALFLFFFLEQSDQYTLVLGVMAGMGMGTVMSTTQLTVQTIAGRQKLGAATALVALSRTMGGAVGTALCGTIAFLSHAGGDEAGFRLAFLFLSVLAALAALIASSVPPITLWTTEKKLPVG